LNIIVILEHTIKKYKEGVHPMMAFNLWKNLKKRLRRNRRSMWSLGALLLSLPLGWLLLVNNDRVMAAPMQEKQQSSILEALRKQEQPLSVKLHRVFICGEEVRLLGRMTNNQVEQLLLANPDWKAVLDEKKRTVDVEKHIEDLSDHCKANAYMSVDKKGNLALFDGVPKEEKVLRTFFQLDVRYMESSLPKDKLMQLNNGIRINDMDEYNSVLSTFSDYAIEPNQKVMKPAY
jgi:forespore regulator of the sigma-K checkpoint